MTDDQGGGRVVARQLWRDVLYLSWRYPPALLRKVVPPEMDLDLHAGWAWAGVALHGVQGSVMTGMPPSLGLDFSQAEVRVYVRAGGRSGVWSLSIDADHRLAVTLGRLATGLPYRRAHLRIQPQGHVFDQDVERLGDGRARLRIRWEVGDPLPAVPGSLPHFLLSRDARFTRRLGRVWRVDARQALPQPRDAFVLVREGGLIAAAGLPRPTEPPLAIYDEGRTVEWLAPALVRSAPPTYAAPN